MSVYCHGRFSTSVDRERSIEESRVMMRGPEATFPLWPIRCASEVPGADYVERRHHHVVYVSQQGVDRVVTFDLRTGSSRSRRTRQQAEDDVMMLFFLI